MRRVTDIAPLYLRKVRRERVEMDTHGITSRSIRLYGNRTRRDRLHTRLGNIKLRQKCRKYLRILAGTPECPGEAIDQAFFAERFVKKPSGASRYRGARRASSGNAVIKIDGTNTLRYQPALEARFR